MTVSMWMTTDSKLIEQENTLSIQIPMSRPKSTAGMTTGSKFYWK